MNFVFKCSKKLVFNLSCFYPNSLALKIIGFCSREILLRIAILLQIFLKLTQIFVDGISFLGMMKKKMMKKKMMKKMMKKMVSSGCFMDWYFLVLVTFLLFQYLFAYDKIESFIKTNQTQMKKKGGKKMMRRRMMKRRSSSAASKRDEDEE